MKTRFQELVSQSDSSNDQYPCAVYSQRADTITVFLCGDEFVTERVDDQLTLHRNLSDEMIGCVLKGVSIMAEHVRHMINIQDDDVEFRFLLLSAIGTKPEASLYYDVSRVLGCIPIPRKELERARRAA
jgi:hypothetical protein